MAKVKGPLFSLGATGALGHSLVYMTWKGIPDVRQYVVPANPKSALQIVQRGYMTDGVDMWHNADWNLADLAAFTLWASLSAGPMSGFNRTIKEYIAARVATGVWHPVTTLAVGSVLSTGFIVTAVGDATVAFTLNYGTSPTAMVQSETVSNTAGVLSSTLTLLTAGTNYYFEIVPTTALEYGRSGIGKQKTSA